MDDQAVGYVPDLVAGGYLTPDQVLGGMTELRAAMAAGIDPAQAAALADRMLGELNVKLGLRVLEFAPERLVATMPVLGNRQPFGLLHGGANAALAETLGSFHSILLAPEGVAPVGVDLNCTHHRAVREGFVTGVCVPVHAGRTASTFDIVISDDAGRRSCTARLTCIGR